MSTPVERKSILLEDNGGYEEFLRGVELISIGLRQCSANLNRSGFARVHWHSDKKPLRRLEDKYSVTGLGKRFFEASGKLSVEVRGSDDASPVLSVECEFEAHLHAVEPISKEFVERFVQSEFKLILVPFARQFISSLTASMSIPPVVVPLSIGSQETKIPSKRSPVKRRAKA